MKLGIVELRDMIAEAVRQTLEEAPKKGSKRPPKDIPMRSVESELETRDRAVRGMPGYSHSEQNDFSKPLGPANIVKRQGASGMGGWTSEAKRQLQDKIHELQVRRLVRMIVAEELAAVRSEGRLTEVTPPGFERVVKGLKKAKGVKNPWAVAWSMKKKGAHPK